jgi:heme exporter protein D
MTPTPPPPGGIGSKPLRPGLALYLMNAVLLLGGLAFLLPALGWTPPLVRVELRAGWAAYVAAAVGATAIALALRSLARSRGATTTLDEVAEKWRRARRRAAPLTGTLAVVGLAAPLLDGWTTAYDIVRGAWVFWLFGAQALLATAAVAWNPEAHIRRQKLAGGEGVRGVATLEDFDDTGTTINDNPMVRLRLRVAVGGGEPYAVERKEVVSRLAVGRLRIGERLPVLVDPEERGEVRVLWKEEAPTEAEPRGGPA